ncbi:N-acetylmuramoyl-L-alanine amidase [Metabacillus fastidiosus]|uniref:N-acetylmuramoyl-L-alanine amidase n=1 Tax=Metabacillus fastidiosus TaxID=1458 RepID=UPI003D2E6DFC
MSFNMKYNIIKDYLPAGTKRRPGGAIKVKFIVSHDTGNPGSTAKGNINYYRNSPNVAASAQLFVDDKEIRECIPALTGTPERAYHVLYNISLDNERYKADANDAAIGVELCWGKGIDSIQAYKRYVWVHAYLCYKFGLDPRRDIIGHDVLDPRRKIDPTNALKYIGKTFNQFIIDVLAEYNTCINEETPVPTPQKATEKAGTTHKVTSGDTLYSIAQKYGKTVAQLKALNPEIDVLALKVGSTLVVDPTGQLTLEAKREKPKPSDQLAEYLKHPPIRPYPGKPVKKGDTGKDVEAIQRAVGASVDGKFGTRTEQLVKKYQAKYSFLTVDGVVGVATWNVMF